ncbi:MAG: hypothetical protein LBN07_04155 [Christensenellaceae bacterium]|nr:hypothetical protein [Christensenellaceae bacterium]
MKTIKKVWVSTIFVGVIMALCSALFVDINVQRNPSATAGYGTSEAVTSEAAAWQYINYGTAQNPINLPYAFYLHNANYDQGPPANPNGYYVQPNNYNATTNTVSDPVHIPLATEPTDETNPELNPHGPLDPYNSNVSIRFGSDDANYSVKVTQLTVTGFVGSTELDLSTAVTTGYTTTSQGATIPYQYFEYDISLHEIGSIISPSGTFDTGTDMLKKTQFGSDPLLPHERIGTYTFNFSYAYSYPNGVSGTTNYKFQFNIINEDIYTAFSPQVYGADKVGSSNYYVYNFNQDTTPTMGFDATKFAPSFTLSKKSSNSITSSTDYTFSQFIKTNSNPSGVAATQPRTSATPTGEIQLSGNQKIYTYKRYFPIIPADGGTPIDKNNPSTYIITDDYSTIDLGDPLTYIVVDYYAEFNPQSFGDYTLNIQYLIEGSSNNYIIAEISESITSLKTRYLSIFGFVADYYNQGVNPKAYTELKNNYTQANAYAVNMQTSNIYSYFSGAAGDNHIFASTPTINTARDIPVTNQAPIRFEFYGTLGSGSQFWTYTDNSTYTAKEQALMALNNPSALLGGQTYYSGATFTQEGIYLVQINYTLSSSLNIAAVPPLGVSGTQFFVFEINNTPPQILVQAISDGPSSTRVATTMTTKYTNQDLRILLPTYTYTFFAPVSVQGQIYNAFNLNTNPNSQTLYKKTETSGIDTTVNIGGTDYNYYVRNQGSVLDYTYSKDTYGFVYVNITYGASRTTYTVRYIVDNSNFSAVELKTVQYNDTNYVKENTFDPLWVSQLTSGRAVDLQALINSAFSLDWNEKLWAQYEPDGLSSNVTAYRLPFENFGATPEALLASNGTDYMVANGYQTTSIEPVAYKNSKGSNIVNSDNFVSANGVYLFYVEDYAGNNFWRMVMLDKTRAMVIQKDNSDTVYVPSTGMPNFVNEETKLIFGTHKVIEITSTAPSSMEYTINGITYNLLGLSGANSVGKLQNTSFFKPDTAFDSATSSYLSVAINKIEYQSTDTSESSTDVGSEGQIKTLPVGNSMITIYPPPPQTGTEFYGEYRYNFKIFPNNNKIISLGRDITSNYEVQMNMDQAQGQYWAYSNEDNLTNNKYIPTKTGTNLNLLKFLFKQPAPGAATHIEQVSYDYYPFDYNAASSYPFSSVALESRTDVLDYAIPNDPTQIPAPTAQNFLVYYVDNGNNPSVAQTLPGKYVFSRTYAYSPSGYGLDIQTRTYTVYVDQNGIISSTYNGNLREVGDNISIILGAETSNPYTFKNFFRTTGEVDRQGNPIILSTNKMPVQLMIPAFKYYNSPRISSAYAFSRLDVNILYTSPNASAMSQETLFNRNSSLYNILNFAENNVYYSAPGNASALPTFSEEGLYTITITDNTGYTDRINNGWETITNVNPKKIVFAFRIVHSRPTATFEVAPNSGSKYTLTESLDNDGHTFATNAKHGEAAVTMSWQDPADPYTAKVAQVNVSSNKSAVTETFNLSDINIEALLATRPNGELLGYNGIISPSYLVSFKIARIATNTFYDTKNGTIYYQYSYTMQFNIEYECIYTIELRYAKLGELNHGFGNFVNNTYTLQIDRTKPTNNISNLLSTDSYLVSSGYYGSSDTTYLLSTFANENQLPGLDQTQGQAGRPIIYDYSFGIQNSYAMNYNASDALKTFYVRKYNKYDANSGASANASLTPDNPLYTSGLNYLQFNPYTYLSDGYIAVMRDGSRFVNMNDNLGFAVNGTTFRAAVMAALKYTSTATAVEISGFYEIIERDLAGNYRAYTIYIGDGAQNFNLFELVASDGTNPPQPFNNAIADPTIYRTLNVTDYKAKLGWAHVSLQNMNTETILINNVAITPYDPKNQNSESIKYLNQFNNAFMAIASNSKFMLSSSTTGFVATQKTINIIVQYAKLPPPEVLSITSSSMKRLIFPKKDSSDPNITTYPMTIAIYGYNSVSGTYSNLIKYFDSIPDDGDPSTEEFEDIPNGLAATFDVDVGTYRIVYTDNFTSTPYEYIINPGIDDVDNNSRYIPVAGSRVSEGGNWFMGHPVTVNYQPLIFSSIIVQRNGIDFFTSSNGDAISTINSAYKSFVLPATPINTGYYLADETIGGKEIYTIKYYDKGGNLVESLSTTITIYNELPAINLRDRDLLTLLTENKPAGSTITTSTPVRIELPEFSANGKYSPVLELEQWTLAGDKIGAPVPAYNGYVVTLPGIYTVTLINDTFGNSRQIRFIIREGDSAFYSVTKTDGSEVELMPSPVKLDLTRPISGGGSNSIVTEIKTRLQSGNTQYTDLTLRGTLINKFNSANTIIDQYFVLRGSSFNTRAAEVKLDASKNLEIAEFRFFNDAFDEGMINPVNSTYITYIYLIYGTDDPIYSKVIAVTEVPATENLVTSFGYFEPNSSFSSLGNAYEKILYKNNVNEDSSTTIRWNTSAGSSNVWYRAGNIVNLKYTFGTSSSTGSGTMPINANGTLQTPAPTNYSTSKIQGTGRHIINFVDMAGNSQVFKNASAIPNSFFSLVILDRVIFNVDYKDIDGETMVNQTPISYMTFNSTVTLKLDPTFQNYYTTPEVIVLLNGQPIQVTKDNTVNGYVFEQSGRYQVSINADSKQSTGTPEEKRLRTAVYNFTILEKTSARLAYEFNEMTGFEIVRIVKDGVDITNQIKKEQIGNPGATLTQLDAYIIKNWFVSADIGTFTNGQYRVMASVKYNDLLAPKLYEFGFFISNAVPIITTDPQSGEATKGTITISYNSAAIYNQIGKAYIKILTYDSNNKTFNEFRIEEINEETLTNIITTISINRTGEYYVQLVSDSGNILSSFKVTRLEPLNTIAIIVIVLGCLAAVALTIVIIKLRTRMKVR